MNSRSFGLRISDLLIFWLLACLEASDKHTTTRLQSSDGVSELGLQSVVSRGDVQRGHEESHGFGFPQFVRRASERVEGEGGVGLFF